MNDKTNKINSLYKWMFKFFSGSLEINEVAQQVAKAYREVGFLLISGHEILKVNRRYLRQGIDFFDLPLKEKQKWGHNGSAKQRLSKNRDTKFSIYNWRNSATRSQRNHIYWPMDVTAATTQKHLGSKCVRENNSQTQKEQAFTKLTGFSKNYLLR